MGMCQSCDTSASVDTAKVILQDGRLQEFSHPIKVSELLQRYPGCFICNSDDMEFDDFASAINGDEQIQLGQLYFLLPLSRLKYPIQAEEMAALAVKASRALKSNGGDRFGGYHRKTAVVPAVACRRERVFRTEVGGVVEKRRGSNGSGRNFTAMLGAIQEE